jgi:DNA-binding MarR family transcriptional regulator
MATLMALEPDAEVDFLYLRNRLQLSDGNLSVHLSRLEEARLVKQQKTFVGRKPRTYIRLTPRGRAAFAEHIAALEEILRPGDRKRPIKKKRKRLSGPTSGQAR